MYVPPAYEIDRARCLAFASAHGFGLTCAFDGSKPLASHLPFHLEYASDGTPRLLFHVARGNPLVGCADGRRSWLVAIQGHHSYVSPHWYVSPDQVPTWLYQAVHLTGTARLMPADELRDSLGALSAQFESSLAPKPAWSMAEMSAARREAMLRAIVGIAMTVESVQSSFKLNQSKSEADCRSVAAALAAQENDGARTIARLMIEMHPQADADQDRTFA